MKVILIKDVKGLGRAHTEVETADGHALNFLIPKKLAIAATSVAKQEAETRRKQTVDKQAVDAALVAQNIASLAEAHIVLTVKANEKGHLYDTVNESDIRSAAKEQAHIELPEHTIKLEKPIKEVGEFSIPVAHGEVFGEFKITVQAEK